MGYLRNRHQNLDRAVRSYPFMSRATLDTGSRNVLRAAPIAQVRLRCRNEACGMRFKAAEPMRCPQCAHPTIELGPAT